MYTFKWELVATTELAEEVVRKSGITPVDPLVQRVQLALVPILERMGGVALSPQDMSRAKVTALGRRLVGRALARVVAGRTDRELPGLITEQNGDDAVFARAFTRLRVNTATAEELDRLPGIGEVLAKAIVAERTRKGAFIGLQDLVDRVDGIGPERREQVATMLDIRAPFIDANFAVRVDPMDYLIDLMTGMSGTQEERLVGTLERVNLLLADSDPSPHPLLYPHVELDLAGVPCDSVQAIWASAYYERTKALINACASTLDIVMFHIAMPSERHPTKALLNAVREAHVRGVAVRLIVDNDRSTDPYMSTVINAAAVAFLREAGVAVRVDRPDRLLHSKLLILDGIDVLVGSHNWAAGSYFQFDDLSLLVRSSQLSAIHQTRFDRQWSEAQG